MEKQKRVAAVHDISGFGKCSLTVALPVISAAGIEVCPLPTAVLSAHTAVPGDFTCRDLSDDLKPFIDHWEALGLTFDAVYSGYLGSIGQVDTVMNFIDRFKTSDNLIIVDPVMADDGKLYNLFDLNFVKEMRLLCRKADIIVPNITEALLLVGREYAEGPYSKDFIEHLIQELSSLAPKVVLTGVNLDDAHIGAACYDKATGKTEYFLSPCVPGIYHGSGDVLASSLTAALVRGKSLDRAVKIAVDFTVGSINRTANGTTDHSYGIDFEHGIIDFAKSLE